MNINMKPIAALLAISLAASPAFAGDKSMGQAVKDARLEGQIATAILFNSHLNPFEISVDVDNNVAVLTGTVDESLDKDLAERVAMNAKGITKVENRIAVDSNWKPKESKDGERNFGDIVSDATVSTSVKSRLLWNDVTDGTDIKVDTNMGRVTLRGTATTAAEKDMAGRIALGTDGVVAVDNLIQVTPGSVNTPTSDSNQPIADSWITTKVKSSLLLSKNVDGLDLTVETKNGLVMLGGSASSTAERDLAIEIAKDIRGVKNVDASAVSIHHS
ncbi:MAG TPA: BON domain-containing protein [Xanthomonadaceae bacterium]|nr:BON domain-containing protein [Xanthomonadaceae bacterium]HRY00874.1 BON domain-containing protein [Xanthomonadaceae bacterium]